MCTIKKDIAVLKKERELRDRQDIILEQDNFKQENMYELLKKEGFLEDTLDEVAKNRIICNMAYEELGEEGVFGQYDFFEAGEVFLNSSIEESLKSENMIIKVLALVDRRVGKRTLNVLKDFIENESELVQYFYQLRCEAERMKIQLLLKEYIEKYFPSTSLSGGLFSTSPNAISIDLEQDMYPYDDMERYLRNILIRSKFIFSDIIREDENMLLVVNIREDVDEGILKLQRLNNFNKFIRNRNIIKNAALIKLEHSLYKYDIGDNINTCRLIMKCKTNDLKINKLLEAIGSQDLGIEPSVNEECFFINIKRNLIFYMYDDRGIDIISSNLTDIKELYDKYSNWITEYIFNGEFSQLG